MAVGNDLVAQRRVTGLLPPTLSEADKEELIAGEPGRRRRGAALKRHAIGVERRVQAGHIGDVLAQGLLAVDGQIGEWAVGSVLRGQARAGGAKVREVIRLPPVLQSSVRI